MAADQIMVHSHVNIPAFDIEAGEDGLIDVDYAQPLLELGSVAVVTPATAAKTPPPPAS